MRRNDVRLTPEQGRLKKASRDSVETFADQTQAGEWIGNDSRPQRHVSERVSLNTPDFFTIDEARRLDAHALEVSGKAPILRAQAVALGFELLPTRVANVGDSELHNALAVLTKEYGDVATGLLEALADGRCEPHEVRQKNLIGEVDDVMGALAKLRAHLVTIEKEG